MTEQTGGTGPGHRSVGMERVRRGVFDVRNDRGGTMRIGTGQDADFTPVELLLAAIAGCSAVDVDFITSKRAEPTAFVVTAGGEKVRDQDGNHLTGIEVGFTVRFPDGPDGDAARAAVPRSVAQSRDRLCTVSRTVQLGTPVAMREV